MYEWRGRYDEAQTSFRPWTSTTGRRVTSARGCTVVRPVSKRHPDPVQIGAVERGDEGSACHRPVRAPMETETRRAGFRPRAQCSRDTHFYPGTVRLRVDRLDL